jgi:hypothetical protein
MRKFFVFLSVLGLVTIAGVFAYRLFSRAQRENHIFCETLEPGMTDSKVLDSLKRFGAIQYSNERVNSSGYDEIAMGFTDSGVVGQNTYILSFQDGRYTGVSVIIFLDDVAAVCD